MSISTLLWDKAAVIGNMSRVSSPGRCEEVKKLPPRGAWVTEARYYYVAMVSCSRTSWWPGAWRACPTPHST